MSLDLTLPAHLVLALLPELVLTAWSVVLLLVVGWRHRTATDLRLAAWVSGVALATTGVVVWWLWWHRVGVEGLASMIAVDDYRFVTDMIFLGTAAVTVLVAPQYLEREGLLIPEFFLLLVFATIGMMLMGGAADLMVLFLGLETMSVALYVMAALDRRSPRSAEAGLKYFLLGAFASGFLLYGIALLYGATGTTNLALIGAQVGMLDLAESPMLLAGIGLLLVGFAFKVAAVPFHMWAPDVYDGSPTPVTGLMASGVKAAAFAALFRVLIEALPEVPAAREVIAGLAVVTMIVGNLVALNQRSIKRMLAWSAVAHAGYLLVAAAAGGPAGTGAFLVYIVAYAATALAAFTIVGWLGRGGEGDVRVDDLAGLAGRRPWLAFGLAVCMLSLLGFPGTVGFIGKWYVLLAAVDAGRWALAVLVVVTSVISAGFYLPVLMVSYMRPAAHEEAHRDVRLTGLTAATVAVAVAAVLALGVRPQPLLGIARETGDSARPSTIFTADAAAPAVAPATPR
jgi:NADH-quinone oxidoreductase subunit N